MSDESASRPVLRVVSGAPTPEELAVVTAVVTAVGAGGAGGPDGDVAAPVRRGGWNDPARQHRSPLLPGPNGWRSAR